jgi:DUF1365 family protein
VTGSALFAGVVSHARVRPRRHRLSYRIFQLLIDLDEAEALDRRLRWFSLGRFNLLSFHPGDHLDGSATPLKQQVQAHLAAAGVDIGGGAVRVLCMPRVLGQAFNPISVWFCHRPDGGLAAMLYEVNNTFGDRHSYLIPVRPQAARASEIRQVCDKAFYVSPFMPMELAYEFRVRPPGEAVSVGIQVSDAHGPLLHTAFAARRRDLSDRAVLAAFAAAPLLALKVLAGIHWEALLIWLKGAAFHTRPQPPARPVTVVAVRPARAREGVKA